MKRSMAVFAGLLLVAACTRRMPASPVAGVAEPAAGPRQESPEFWRAEGQRTLARLQRPLTARTQARNVILFVGDGMGIPTITAAHILQGQQRGASGEEHLLAFERFPSTALSKTYTVDLQTSESAGTMSAMMTGIKTRGGAIAVDQVPESGQCREAQGHEVPTLLEDAEDAGMATGVVSTARITHATPAATYAHVSERDWEADANIPAAQQAEGCRDIARQLAEFAHGDGIEVVLGGGRRFFMPETQRDPEDPTRSGTRKDGRDLLALWRERYPRGTYVWNKAQFDAIDWASSGPVLGLFEPDHMEFEADRARDAGGEPSLTEMTRAAITSLRRNPRGYFLMVEAGRIDHGHHAGNAYRALTDAIELSNAVQAAVDMTREDDTLIIVTADHSHTFGMVGYPGRGNPIFGLVRDEQGRLSTDALGQPYTTLTYANGPGYPGASSEQPEGPKRYPHASRGSKGVTQGRPRLTNVATDDPDYLQESAMPMGAETHGGEDVAIFARGPGSQWVHGAIEQNTIYWIMQAVLPRVQARR